MKPPSYLDRQAKIYFRKLAPSVSETAKNEHILTLLCDSLSVYRAAVSDGNLLLRKTTIDQILKLTKELEWLEGQSDKDAIDDLLGE